MSEKDTDKTRRCAYCENEPAETWSDQGKPIGKRCLPKHCLPKHEDGNYHSWPVGVMLATVCAVGSLVLIWAIITNLLYVVFLPLLMITVLYGVVIVGDLLEYGKVRTTLDSEIKGENE